MKNIRILLGYLSPFKWQAFKNVIFNILSAFFALFVITLIKPFLGILFNEINPDDISNTVISFSSIGELRDTFLASIITGYGKLTALMLVSIIVILASLFKNGFIFLAYNNMASMRAGTVRNLRKKMYAKVLRLPLSYFSDARKGDVMTRISNDVQEIESSIM